MTDVFPIDWNAFHLLRPEALWLFVPLVILLVAGLVGIREETGWQSIVAPHLRKYVIQKGSERIKIWMIFGGFVCLSFGILALAGPAWNKVDVPGQQLETPVVILLDLSQSMLADDLQPNRLERAKFKIHDLLVNDPQARTALIGFAGTAHLIVPLTKDYDIILSHLDGLSPSVMPFPGSDLESALSLADSIMLVTDAPGTILVYSDDYEESYIRLFSEYLASNQHRIRIIPLNTESGSEVPGTAGSGPMRTSQGQVAFSSLNTDVLTRLATLDRLTVHPLTLDDSDAIAISEGISESLIYNSQPEETDNDWQDRGLLLVIPMAFLILLWFRKGWVIYTVMVLLFSSCGEVDRFEDLWYTKDYQGQRLSDKGEYEEAAGRYTNPMRKGIAYYKAGNYEASIKAFMDDTTAAGTYNLGLAYYQNGDTTAAMLAFEEAATLDPAMEQARVLNQMLADLTEDAQQISPEDATEEEDEEQKPAKNSQNDSMEDLGGGGQEATNEDMQKEREEETVATDIRKGQELDEVPEDVGAGRQQESGQILMRKVDDDPSLFLKRKFEFQVKTRKLKPRENEKKW